MYVNFGLVSARKIMLDHKLFVVNSSSVIDYECYKTYLFFGYHFMKNAKSVCKYAAKASPI